MQALRTKGEVPRGLAIELLFATFLWNLQSGDITSHSPMVIIYSLGLNGLIFEMEIITISSHEVCLLRGTNEV